MTALERYPVSPNPMRVIRFSLLCFSLIASSLFAQPDSSDRLVGRVEGSTYVSPTGAFRVSIPVLPELGGRIVDTDNVVTFQDNYSVLSTIAAFPMDATLRWEFSTRGQKEYLAYFFANHVLPDFQESFPGARAEVAKYAPGIANGALLVYLLLPGGSMFTHKLAFLNSDDVVPDAKRGNLVLVRDSWTYVLSIELAERITERTTYNKTTEEEDEVLRQRLIDLVNKIEFSKPAVPAR